VLLERGGCKGAERGREIGLDGGDPFLDRPGVGAHFQRCGREEAAAGEDAALHTRGPTGNAPAARSCETAASLATIDGLEAMRR